MNLSKHQFCQILDIIQNLIKEQEKVSKILGLLFPEQHAPMCELGFSTITSLIDYLQEHTLSNGEDVSWYVWECDLGKSPGKWSFVHDGHTYEFLCESHESFYASLVMWERIKGGNV